MGVGGGGRRHGDQEGTEGEIILMILSNVPFLYEEQKKMFRDENYWRLPQAGYIGLQYYCFNCLKSCPVGQEK